MIFDKPLLKQFLRASTVGLNIVIATLVGLGIGFYLDKYLGTRPWLTIIFLILGIAAGFSDLARLARFEDKNEKANDKDSTGRNEDNTKDI